MNRAALLALSLLATPGCVQPECATRDYRGAECRVIVENELARARTPGGLEVRFQEPDAQDTATWIAGGLLEGRGGDPLLARVAGPGGFALSIEPTDGSPDVLELVLDNVDPRAAVSVGPLGEERLVAPNDTGALRRRVTVDSSGAAPIWVRGRRDCPTRYRLALTADIQTNPDQFQRIVERLQLEAEAGASVAQPLVGLVIAGDLSDASRDDEFDTIAEILDGSPVPVAVTAGNHDIYRRRYPLYNRRFGPGNYAVNVCRTRLVMLDTGSGAIARSVEARLPELFDRNGAEYLILAMHHPPYAGLTGSGWSREDIAQHLLAEAALAGADLIVAGHNHALRQFDSIPVGDRRLRELIVGTGGAFQGVTVPRFGYVRLTFDDGIDACFVEVPPVGYVGPANRPSSSDLPYCREA